MDVVINLIILLVVISSVLKRFSEVAKKGAEVKRPATAPPLQRRRVPTQSAEAPDTIRTPAPPALPVPPEQRRSIGDLVEELQRGYREIVEPQPEPGPVAPPEPVYDMSPSYNEDTFEQTTDGRAGYTPEAIPAMPVTRPASTAAPSSARPLPSLAGTSLMNAFIMGEILGPPVALRTGIDAHRLI